MNFFWHDITWSSDIFSCFSCKSIKKIITLCQPSMSRALSLQHVDLTIGADGRIHRQTVAPVSLMTHPARAAPVPSVRACSCASVCPLCLPICPGRCLGLSGRRKKSRSNFALMFSHLDVTLRKSIKSKPVIKKYFRFCCLVAP